MTVLTDAVAPAGWGARIDYDTWSPSTTPRDKVVVHYGGGANRAGYIPDAAKEMEVLRGWERWHIDGRGWRGIGYGWAVGQTGTLYRLRGFADYAAHRGDYEPDGIPENREAFPVVFILGGDQQPTVDAVATFTDVHQALEAHTSTDLPVYGHQEIAQHGTGTSTACPGAPLMTIIEQLRQGDPVTQFTAEEVRVLRELVAAVRDRASNGTFAGYAIDLIRSHRTNGDDPHHRHPTDPVTYGDVVRLTKPDSF